MKNNNEPKYCIYMHKNKINGKIYIGKTCNKPEHRWAHGKGYIAQRVFGNAIKKYGWDGFEHIIIAKDLTEEEARKMEIDLISKYQSNKREYGYNMTDGGEGWRGCHHSEEWKEMFREYNRTRVITPEMRKNMSDAQKGKHIGQKNHFFGKKHTDETKEKISKANKGRLAGDKNPFYGKTHTEETRRKLSEANKGKTRPPMTEETRQKLSASLKIAQNKPEVKDAKSKKMRGENNPMYGKPAVNAKPVSQYTKDGEWIADYPSAMHAKKATGVSNCSIASCCKGHLNSAGGFIWKYK